MFIQHIIRERNPESDIPYKAPLFCNVFWHCLFWQNGIVSTRKRRGTNFEFDSDSGVGCIGNRKGKAGLRGKEYVEVCPNKKEPFRNSNSGERGIFWAKHRLCFAKYFTNGWLWIYWRTQDTYTNTSPRAANLTKASNALFSKKIPFNTLVSLEVKCTDVKEFRAGRWHPEKTGGKMWQDTRKEGGRRK